MTRAQLDSIVTLIFNRYKAVIPLLINLIPNRIFRWFFKFGQPAIRFLAREPLTNALIKNLGDSYKD